MIFADHMTSRYLAVVDADRIQSYVFSSRELKQIRGGSRILRELTETKLPEKLGPGEQIVAGGGRVFAVFGQRDQAVAYCRRAAEYFKSFTAASGATWAVATWDDDWGLALDRVFGNLELNKSGRGEASPNSGSPYWKTCEKCGIYPASRSFPEGGDTQLYCAACAKRRDYSESGRLVAESTKMAGCSLSEIGSFEDLGSHSRPENYLALVYLDLDRLGAYLKTEGRRCKERYAEISKEIKAVVESSMTAGCAAACREMTEGEHVPFEVLLMGGDDAVVMLAAQAVFPFLEAFDRQFQALLPKLSFSAGVVWAHQQFPIAQFLARAKELVRSAKQKRGNTVDWLIVTQAMIKPIEDLRRLSSRDGYERTRRPCEIRDFVALRDTVRTWKSAGMPSRKVKDLYCAAHEGFEQGVLDYWFAYSRLEETHRFLWNEFFPNPEGLWENTSPRRTGAADLAELWDFVEAR